MSSAPSVFLSYSWDTQEHKQWVKDLAERLVSNGVQVRFDQWDLALGDSLTEFMEAQIGDCDFVLIICTPEYAKKSTTRAGGVGYEQQIISGSLATGVPRRKFIPVLRTGELKVGPDLAIPPHFTGILALDMRGPTGLDTQFEALLRAIYKVPAATAPPLGTPPAFLVGPSQPVQVTAPNKPARLAVIEFDGWHLLSGVAMNEHHPATFSIPDAEARLKIVSTDFVKLGFEVISDDPDDENGVTTLGERMWVKVSGSYGPYLWGTLSNTPTFNGKDIGLEFGSEVVFLPEHILDVVDSETQKRDEEEFIKLQTAKRKKLSTRASKKKTANR